MSHSANNSCIEIIRQSDAPRRFHRALTMLEMVIALAIMAVVFAAVLPQFRNIQNSWASRQGGTEALQNGRILIDHMNKNLSSADRITAVSDPDVVNGFIEFEANDAITYRYEISSDRNVEFGPVGNLSELAGPVSQLQFTCYDAQDLDTAITDIDQIRGVKVQTTLTNMAPLGQDKNFVAIAYLRTNSIKNLPPIYKEPASSFEFNVVLGAEPALVQVEPKRYLCAYTGPGTDGWALVVEVDTDSWTLNRATPFEFDLTTGTTPALSRIDATHYLCAYTGPGNDGYVVILSVDPSDWTITKGPELEYDGTNGEAPALVAIDSTHHLCVYQGTGDDGWAVVFDVDTGSDTVVVNSSFEFEIQSCMRPALVEIKQGYYLCAYEGPQNDGWATVLKVSLGSYSISSPSTFEYDIVSGQGPALARIDISHYLCAYAGTSDNGYAVVLSVQQGTWQISRGTPFQYDSNKSISPDLKWIDGSRFLCVYEGPSLDAWSNILTVDTDDWTITKDQRVEYDSVGGETPALAMVEGDYYLCVYQGSNNDGWACILSTEPPVLP